MLSAFNTTQEIIFCHLCKPEKKKLSHIKRDNERILEAERHKGEKKCKGIHVRLRYYWRLPSSTYVPALIHSKFLVI